MRAGVCYVCRTEGARLASFPHSVTSESKLLPGASDLYLCGRCGHLHTSAKMDLGAYYAAQYDALLTDEGMDEIVSTSDGQIVFRTDLDYGLFRRIAGSHLTPDSTIFEYGCGRGRILSRLVKDGFRKLQAYDLSESYREPVSRLIAPENVFIGRKPEGLRADLACSFFVLEHDGDPVDSLLFLRSVLKPDGLLYLMLPNYVTNSIDLACADHVNHFSARYLEALLRECGFEVLTCDDTSNIGAVLVLARPTGPAKRREELPLDHPELVAYAKTTSRELIEYVERLEALVAALEKERRVFLYGAGFYAALTNAYLQAAGIAISGIFDANPRKQGSERLGRAVLSPETISPSTHGDACLIVCVNPRIAGPIATKLAGSFARTLSA